MKQTLENSLDPRMKGSASARMHCQHRSGPVEIAAIELEARVLYSGSPLPFADGDLLLATDGNANAGGLNWDAENVVRFGDPDLDLGSSTDGTFSEVFDLGDFAGSGAHINSLHSVQNDVTIGSGSNAFDLEVGDLIFTSDSSHTFVGNTTTVTGDNRDIFVFRSDVVGDYSSGEFIKLFEDPLGSSVIDGLALVDKAGGLTLPDGSVLPQGTFIFSRFASSDVGTFFLTGTSLSFGSLVDGSDLGFEIDENINALHIVQNSHTVGGVSLEEGDLLIAVQSDENVGSPSTFVRSQDIARLRFSSSLSSAAGSTFFDGSDIGLNNSSSNENIEAITLGITNAPPDNISIDNDSIDENTDTTSGVVIGTLDSDDADPSTVVYEVVGSSAFSVTSGNQLTVTGLQLDFETTNSYVVTIRATDAQGLSSTQDLTISVNDLNEAPVVENPLATITRPEDANSFTVDLSSTFSDVDMDNLVLSLGAINNPGLVSATISGDILTVSQIQNQSGTATIQINASDGQFSVSDSLIVNVDPVNDAPVLSGSISLPDINRNSVPSGQRIGTLVAANVSDVDAGDQLAGIAVINNPASSSQGTWQYFDSSSSQWRDIGPASTSSAVTLSVNHEIRFLPATGFSGTPGLLEFVAIDSSYTGGFSSTSVVHSDVSFRGNDLPFSVDSRLIEIDVTSVDITVDAASSLTTSESGSTATFDVVLDSAPNALVTITLSSSDPDEGTISTNQLQFDATNWFIPQQVLITGGDDLVDDGNQTFQVRFDSVSSSDTRFDGLQIASLNVTNIDNDQASIEVSKSRIVTNELGQQDTFSVRLSSQPVANVVIVIENTDSTEAFLSESSLTFTPSNFDIPQFVSVTGMADASQDDDQSFQIVLRPMSNDPVFDSLSPKVIDGENIDLGAVAPPVVTADSDVEAEEESDSETALVDPTGLRRQDQQSGVDVIANKPRILAESSVARVSSISTDTSSILANISIDVAETDRFYISRQTASQLSQLEQESLSQTDPAAGLPSLWSSLDHLGDRIEQGASHPVVTAGTVASVASVFTAGYLAWLIRGGHLLVGLLSQLPAWSNLDLLTVLSSSESELNENTNSLESLVTKDQHSATSEPSGDLRQPQTELG